MPSSPRRPLVAFGSLAAFAAAAGLATQSAGRAQPEPVNPQTDPVYPLTNSADPGMMVNDLAGVFRVEYRINPHQWYGNTAMLNPDGTPASTDPIGVNQPANAANQGEGVPDNNDPAAAPRDATGNPIPTNSNQNPRANQNQGQPGGQFQGENPAQVNERAPGGQTARTAGSSDQMRAALNGAVTVLGYCEKRWVLGGNILQEVCVVPDLGQVVTEEMLAGEGGGGSGSGRNADGRQVDDSGNLIEDIEIGRPSLEALEGDRMFQGISYLTFNEQTGQFALTSMDSRQVDALSAVGQFVPGANRIEFALTPGTQFGTGGPFSRMNQGVNQGMDQGFDQDGRAVDDRGVRGTNQVVPTNQTGNQQGNNTRTAPGTTNSGTNTNPNQRTTTTAPNQANPNSTANPANARQPGAVSPNNPNATANQPGNRTGNQTGTQPVNPATDPASTTGNNRLTQQRDINTGAGGIAGDFGQSGLTASSGAFDNVRVVLEFISPDQHRVTLYRLNPGQAGSEFFNPFIVQPGARDPSANPRNNPSDDFDDDDVVGVVPDQRTGNQGADNTGNQQNQPGNTTGATGNAPSSQQGTDQQTNPGTTPRTTGTAPRTSSGQPTQTVPDAPGTRPNNADQPAANQPNTTPGTNNNTPIAPGTTPARNQQPGQNDGNQNQAGQPVAPGTVVVDPNNPNRVNQGGNQFDQPGQGQFNDQFAGDEFAADSTGWVVIWQATYTRVDGAEAARVRNHLQRADQLAQNFMERQRARQAGVRDDN